MFLAISLSMQWFKNTVNHKITIDANLEIQVTDYFQHFSDVSFKTVKCPPKKDEC